MSKVDGITHLSQISYIENIVTKNRVTEAKNTFTPLPPAFKFSPSEYESLDEKERNYVTNFPVREIMVH